MLLVVALGGNALMRRGEPPEALLEVANVTLAAAALAPLAAEHRLVVTHGNGPQIGLLALESSSDPALQSPYPLDALGAETQGLIGYWLVRELGNELPHVQVTAVVTRTEVSRDDPAFQHPSKPVGAIYDEAEAQRVGAAHNWTMAPDGTAWRRVVASPQPRRIVEAPTIAMLAERENGIVVCCGGGGIPVVADGDGGLRGIEAVIDKDHTSALLAESLHADGLLLLTDVAGVERGFGTPAAEPIRCSTPEELRLLEFAPGSMGPKVAAACTFVERTGRFAAIGKLTEVGAVLRGDAGTMITP